MYQNYVDHCQTTGQTSSSILHWQYNHSGWILPGTFVCISPLVRPLQAANSLSECCPREPLILREWALQEALWWKRQLSVTERWLTVRTGGSDILILCTSHSTIRHWGIRCAVTSSDENVRKLHKTNSHEFGQALDISISTHSSMLGSRPSKTILFLIAITGTPCDR